MLLFFIICITETKYFHFLARSIRNFASSVILYLKNCFLWYFFIFPGKILFETIVKLKRFLAYIAESWTKVVEIASAHTYSYSILLSIILCLRLVPCTLLFNYVWRTFSELPKTSIKCLVILSSLVSGWLSNTSVWTGGQIFSLHCFSEFRSSFSKDWFVLGIGKYYFSGSHRLYFRTYSLLEASTVWIFSSSCKSGLYSRKFLVKLHENFPVFHPNICENIQ